MNFKIFQYFKISNFRISNNKYNLYFFFILLFNHLKFFNFFKIFRKNMIYQSWIKSYPPDVTFEWTRCTQQVTFHPFLDTTEQTVSLAWERHASALDTQMRITVKVERDYVLCTLYSSCLLVLLFLLFLVDVC